MLSDADLVWNRACLKKVDEATLRGDRALASVILFHSMAMNGGVLHAFEALEPRERAAAKSGYRFFGFHDVAELISDMGSAPTALEISEVQEASFDMRYQKSVPEDAVLSRCFEEYFEVRKADFAPLSDDDRRTEGQP